MDPITVRPVFSSRDRRRFIKFLWTIYDDIPQWVPPLIMDRRKLIDKKRNPFYKHADAEFFIAERNDRMVGRIAAIVNHNHNAEHNENIGFFGFFESVNDRAVSTALFDAAFAYLKERGVQAVRGPANPSVNDEYGLLIEGFEHPPAILMPYNPPYYADLVEAYGFRKVKDLYSYRLTEEKTFTEKFERVNRLIRERNRITIRTLDMKRFRQEVELVKEIYNKGWARNWGAVAMTDDEIDAMAADLKPIVVPEIVLFAESQGRTIGFALSLPDINLALKYNRRGWLLPGLLHIFLRRKQIHAVRIIVLGVLPEYQRTGAAALLFYETAVRATKLGYHTGEAGWVLEDNIPMIRAAETMNGELYKKYRIYEKEIV